MSDAINMDKNSVMRRGLKALETQLGIIEIEQFISILNREKNDYTEWRKILFEDMTDEEFHDAALDYRHRPFLLHIKLLPQF